MPVLWFVVTRATSDPSGSITYNSDGPSRSLIKAMRCPSGDHAGPDSVLAVLVMLTTVPAAASMTTTSRYLVKAM
jgi:hypothetical protein